MKYLSTLVAFGMALAMPTAAQAQDETGTSAVNETQLALAREVVDNGFPPETRMESMVGVADQLITQMRAGSPQLSSDSRLNEILNQIMDEYSERVLETARTVLARHIDDLMDGMAVAYADTFTQAELEALRDFVTSPEGYGILTRMTDISSHPAVAEANQAYITEYMAYMPGLQAELQAALVEATSEGGTSK